MLSEEKEYLEYALKKINMEIDKSKEQLKKLCKDGASLSFEDRRRGAHFNINALAGDEGKKMDILTRAIPSPYFGRIDFFLMIQMIVQRKFILVRVV